MKRRSFLSTVTAGLVAPAASDAKGLPEIGGLPLAQDSPTRMARRQYLLEEIDDNLRFVELETASDGDLNLLAEILRDWGSGGFSTDRSSGLCWAIDVNMGRDQRRLAVCEPLVRQVETVVDVLEAVREKHPMHSSDMQRDALIGAVAAFASVANQEQVEALSKAVARHYARLPKPEAKA